jgi:pimeloyl-ACP methyl ester carboxylesterase
VSRFTSFDGVEIAFRTWNDDAPGPPVLLHHGFIADAELNWVTPGVVAALVGAGRSVVAHDARGHGRSDKPHDPARYGEATMVRDLGALADHLGLDEFDLGGYSMGAVVSLLAATEDRRIRRLLVGGVGAGIVEVGGVDSRALRLEAVAGAMEADDPSTITDPTARLFRRFADAIGGDRLAYAAHARAAHQADMPLERITAPTMLVVGEADALAVRPEVLTDAIPDAELVVVPGTHLDAVAEPAFIAAVTRFLTP